MTEATKPAREFLMRPGLRLVPCRLFKTNSRNGEEWMWRLVWRSWGLRLGFFEHVSRQDWSPLMSECLHTRGIIIGGTEIGYSRRWRRWKDGKQPRFERTDGGF